MRIKPLMKRVGMIPMLLTGLAIFASVPGAAAGKELKLAHFMAPMHILHQRVFLPLAEDLVKKTNGSVSIKIYPSESLGKGAVHQYKRAVEGAADISFCILNYTAGLFPRSLLVGLPGITSRAEEATRKLWDAFDAHLKDEYREVKVLGIWVMSPKVLIARNRGVAKIADIKGMKVVVSLPVETEFVRACNAVPVAMPITEAYNALHTGIVDAVMMQPSALYKPWNLAEAARYVIDNLPGTTSVVLLAMNKRSWNELPAKDQAVLDKLTGREFSVKAGEIWGALDREALEKAKNDPKITYVSPDAEGRAGFVAAARQVIEAELGRLEKKGLAIRALFDAISR